MAESLPARVAARAKAQEKAAQLYTYLHPRLRQWRRYWLRDPLLGALNLALHYGCRLLPIDWVSALGARLGALNGRHRFQVSRGRAERGYVRLCGEGTPAADATAAVDRLFAHVGRVMLEFSVLDRLWQGDRIAVEGSEHVLAARAAGRPLLVVGLHLGNWEAIGPTLIGLGLSGFKGFYQPPRSRFEHKIAVAARARYGAIALRPGIAAARTARRLLVEERGILLVYADEERRGHVSAPLFGRAIPPRANILDIVRLAAASGAAVVPAYVARLGAGARFRVTFLPPVELAADAPTIDNVHRLDRVIAPLVLTRLDQWYMLFDYDRE
jgi:KDO2-lipid IV(A) lauroyltransferase